jgi:hypothetical protein
VKKFLYEFENVQDLKCSRSEKFGDVGNARTNIGSIAHQTGVRNRCLSYLFMHGCRNRKRKYSFMYGPNESGDNIINAIINNAFCRAR